MAVKGSADGCEPAFLDRTNQHRKVAPIPFASAWAEGMKSTGPSKAGEKWATGQTTSAANYAGRKE